MLLAERDVALTQRDALITALADRVAELEASLGKNSRNSLDATEQRRAG